MEHVKYPRTSHLPWSNPSSDDEVMEDLSCLVGEEIVVTIKMDGENCLDHSAVLETSDGQMTISEICGKDNREIRVLALDHECDTPEMVLVESVSVLESMNEEWFEIEMETGEVILLTGNHRVWIPELSCYRRVKDLDGTEELLLSS